MKQKSRAMGSARGVNTESGMRSGWFDEDYMKRVGSEVRPFSVSTGETIMTVNEAVRKHAERPGSVGTVEAVI